VRVVAAQRPGGPLPELYIAQRVLLQQFVSARMTKAPKGWSGSNGTLKTIQSSCFM